MVSVNATLDRYSALLAGLAREPKADPGVTMNLENRDLDTGAPVKPGAYPLTDQTYAKLLDQLTKLGEPVPGRLKRDIEDYYADPAAPIATKKNTKEWRRVQAELVRLEAMPVVPLHTAE